MSRRTYIAAPLTLLTEARAAAELVHSWGHDIVSTWHVGEATIALERTMSDADVGALGDRCLAEVGRCNTLVLLYGPRVMRSGNVLEAGFALGRGTLVIAVPVTRDAEIPTRMLHGRGIQHLPYPGMHALWAVLGEVCS